MCYANVEELNMEYSRFKAISPLDGRYQEQLGHLQNIFSEAGLNYLRLTIEIEWFKALAKEKKIKELPPFSKSMLDTLEKILRTYDHNSALRIKELEIETRHDVKAVEYFLKEKLAQHKEFKPYLEFIHFGATSDDINNLAYALALKMARNQEIMLLLAQLIEKLQMLAHQYAKVPMLARTHGQAATPTTVGKEFANFCFRLITQTSSFLEANIAGKINGAVGNFNAACIAYPDVNWPKLAENFVKNLGLTYNPYTTQIEPHDYIAEYAHHLIRINNILIGVCRDIWGYISLGYFTQKIQPNEVGSSTMPHKINPIDFENAEGNFGVANALLEHFANKLPISRWQRDLSDSTVMRNLGVAIGHSMIAYNSLLKGLNKIAINEEVLATDLENHWEILGEAIQTVMRRYGIKDSYEKLKQLTRGHKIDKQILYTFITELPIPEAAKKRLLHLIPANYLGIAAELAKMI